MYVDRNGDDCRIMNTESRSVATGRKSTKEGTGTSAARSERNEGRQLLKTRLSICVPSHPVPSCAVVSYPCLHTTLPGELTTGNGG